MFEVLHRIDASENGGQDGANRDEEGEDEHNDGGVPRLLNHLPHQRHPARTPP